MQRTDIKKADITPLRQRSVHALPNWAIDAPSPYPLPFNHCTREQDNRLPDPVLQCVP